MQISADQYDGVSQGLFEGLLQNSEDCGVCLLLFAGAKTI